MKNYKLNMSIVLSCTNNNFRASFIELNLAHKKVIGERLKAMRREVLISGKAAQKYGNRNANTTL